MASTPKPSARPRSVAIRDRTDALNFQGDALCDLAEVLAAAGRTDEAADALEQALERYERKKNLAMVAQVKPKLEALRQKRRPSGVYGHEPGPGSSAEG